MLTAAVDLSPGTARGELVGGNLSLIAKTLGSSYEIQTQNRVLFMEDFGETVEALGAMLRRLADGGKIAVCNGVILGTFVRCGEECKDPVVRRQRLDTMVRGILEPFRKPLLANVRSGHGMPMATLPLGVEVEFDAAARTLLFLEPATRE